MNSILRKSFKSLLACALLFSLPPKLMAWAPNANDLSTAITSADFAAYENNLRTWLSAKAPATISQETLKPILEDATVALPLAQRQFIAKVGPANLANFAKAAPANKTFLTWLLGNSKALHEFLLAATPLSIPAREDNSYGIGSNVLENWKNIFTADPLSKDGINLRIAIATSIRPPGTGSPGSGQQKVPSTPLVRYQYLKDAHAKRELFPSFDKLTTWEMTHVVCSGGSEVDLSWGRDMVRTMASDLLEGERVVDTTSMVWRRNSPVPHVDYKTVLDGGGKCGPRSSWSVFICQAWGIPAIGVGQPAHACVAYKSLNGWQVAYGRGWDASKLEGMGGREFLASVASRDSAAFPNVERLRWFSTTLPAKEQTAAVVAVAKALDKTKEISDKDLKASQKAEEMDANSGGPLAKSATAKPVEKPEPPAVVPPGVIHVLGSSFAETGGITCWGGEPRVSLVNSYGGGKQIYFPQGMASCWVGYKVNVPETGFYELTAKVATINTGMALYVRSFGAMATVKSATATNVYRNQVKELGPQFAVDNNFSTRWAVNGGVDQASLDMDLGAPTPVSTIMVDERAYEKVSKFRLEYKLGTGDWKQIFEGTTIGNSYAKDFPQVTADHVRLTTLDCSGNVGGPSFWEVSVGTVQDGHGWISLPWTAATWQNSKPIDVRLVKGERMIWINAPYQRGVALKSFDLKFKGTAPQPAQTRASL